MTMLAKRFFYVCAGVLCLALAYHLGAESARGQSTSADCFAVDSESGSVAVVGRTMYVRSFGGPYGGPEVVPIAIPGSLPIIACAPYAVLLENGDTYKYLNPENGWLHSGNVFSSQTPATHETWGGVKARYRPGATGAPQNK
jgi:hypothetical protein